MGGGLGAVWSAIKELRDANQSWLTPRDSNRIREGGREREKGGEEWKLCWCDRMQGFGFLFCLISQWKGEVFERGGYDFACFSVLCRGSRSVSCSTPAEQLQMLICAFGTTGINKKVTVHLKNVYPFDSSLTFQSQKDTQSVFWSTHRSECKTDFWKHPPKARHRQCGWFRMGAKSDFGI